MSSRNLPRKPGAVHRGGFAARRDLGLDLLAQGRGVRDVARSLDVDERTVTRWRETPEGQARLARAEEDRERIRAVAIEAERNTVVDARQRLHELALRAVSRLEEALDDDDVQARLRAAREVLDRAGVPRTERVENAEADLDFSSLSPEERAQLRELLTKAEAGGGPVGHA